MGVYRMKLAGRRKPILVKAESIAKAKDAIVEGEKLDAEEMADALANGESVWKPGDELPADDPAPVDDGYIDDGKIDPVGALRKAGQGDAGAGATS
jgi:hypothetical protein